MTEAPSFNPDESLEDKLLALYGRASMQDSPRDWLKGQVEQLLAAAKQVGADETRHALLVRLDTRTAELNEFKRETREICVEYFRDGKLCKEESEKIAERLGLDKWWGFTYTVEIPAHINFTIEAEEELDEDTILQLVDVELSESRYTSGVEFTSGPEIEWDSYGVKIEEGDD